MAGIRRLNPLLIRRAPMASLWNQVRHASHLTTSLSKNNSKKIIIDFCNIRGLNSYINPVNMHLQLSNLDLLFLTEKQIPPNYDFNRLQFPHYHTFTNLKFNGLYAISKTQFPSHIWWIIQLSIFNSLCLKYPNRTIEN